MLYEFLTWLQEQVHYWKAAEPPHQQHEPHLPHEVDEEHAPEAYQESYAARPSDSESDHVSGSSLPRSTPGHYAWSLLMAVLGCCIAKLLARNSACLLAMLRPGVGVNHTNASSTMVSCNVGVGLNQEWITIDREEVCVSGKQ